MIPNLLCGVSFSAALGRPLRLQFPEFLKELFSKGFAAKVPAAAKGRVEALPFLQVVAGSDASWSIVSNPSDCPIFRFLDAGLKLSERGTSLAESGGHLAHSRNLRLDLCILAEGNQLGRRSRDDESSSGKDLSARSQKFHQPSQGLKRPTHDRLGPLRGPETAVDRKGEGLLPKGQLVRGTRVASLLRLSFSSSDFKELHGPGKVGVQILNRPEISAFRCNRVSGHCGVRVAAGRIVHPVGIPTDGPPGSKSEIVTWPEWERREWNGCPLQAKAEVEPRASDPRRGPFDLREDPRADAERSLERRRMLRTRHGNGVTSRR